MKRFLLNFFLAVFYTATVSAANAAISRTIPTKNINENTIEEKANTPANSTNRATVSRNVSRLTQRNSRNTQSDSGANARSVNTRKTGVRATLKDGVDTVGRNARTESASINANPALRRAGITLRASTAEVGGRATIGNSNVQTGSNIDEQVRGVHSRASLLNSNKQKTITTESLEKAKDIMEKTSDLNNICQQQYNECMDQFCAVIDTNQKRCSCSANLSKYAKAQKAVEDANVELNDVAQQIRYVGLSADEIRAIMSATEAELELSKTKDNTKTRSMLDDIADMIKDPTSSTTLNSTTSDSLLDLDLDFSSDSSDLFSLDLFNTSGSDISSKRGTALYNEAKKRCKTVLNNCKDAGGNESQISGNYDLAISKDCIAYEQGLEKLNQKLVNNVRSANLMLQKARLAVLQDKNEYDAKECIGALEKCMLDDMVCGEDYVKCLDPTKVYIDENGNVVLGRNITAITDIMQGYNNAAINADFIKYSKSCSGVNLTSLSKDGSCIVNYLMQKIGTGQSIKDGGLCRPVLDKCQYYTYEKSGKKSTYLPYNDIVVSYIQRAMVNIKAAQSKIISDYASTCMSEVEKCYNQQTTQITSWSTSASVDNIYRVMTGACYNVALTCGYAVFAYDKEMGETLESESDEQDRKNALIRGISEMFYQSLLCPDNSEFNKESVEGASDVEGYVNPRCKCKTGYSVYGSSCVLSCPSGTYKYKEICKSDCPDGFIKTATECIQLDASKAGVTYVVNDNDTWTTKFSYGEIKGSSGCHTTDAIFAESGNPVGSGDKCWCQMTNFVKNNETPLSVSPVPWVFVKTISGCTKTDCSKECAINVQNNQNVRSAVFGSFAASEQ